MKNLSRSKSVFNSSDVPNAPRSLRRSGLAMLSVVSLGIASCASGPNAQTGTVLGGLGGAA
ncbi:MAG: hypothetical protein JWL81_2628, partial [Verrucomicrobiales bacterium]|nr:hypothetical protein [Verrucomicrobiales bacterium]